MSNNSFASSSNSLRSRILHIHSGIKLSEKVDWHLFDCAKTDRNVFSRFLRLNQWYLITFITRRYYLHRIDSIQRGGIWQTLLPRANLCADRSHTAHILIIILSPFTMSATQSSSKSVDTPPSICDRNLIRAPGPGKYELSKYSDFSTTTTPLHSHANRWSFTGKQHDRHPRLTEETPGPDKYSHPVTSFGGIKYTMAKRLHTVSKEEREQNRQAQQMTG